MTSLSTLTKLKCALLILWIWACAIGIKKNIYIWPIIPNFSMYAAVNTKLKLHTYYMINNKGKVVSLEPFMGIDTNDSLARRLARAIDFQTLTPSESVSTLRGILKNSAYIAQIENLSPTAICLFEIEKNSPDEMGVFPQLEQFMKDYKDKLCLNW